jgi:sporulation protein YlmC with PRC-barrel domain
MFVARVLNAARLVFAAATRMGLLRRQTMATTHQGDTSRRGANIVGAGRGEGPGPEVMAADTLEGDAVYSSDDEHVGKIDHIMLDVRGGNIAYAVLSTGGFLGIGDTLYAIPWSALTLDTEGKCFILNQTAERVRSAPGFDKNHWPAMAEARWGESIHEYYGSDPYWRSGSDTTADADRLAARMGEASDSPSVSGERRSASSQSSSPTDPSNVGGRMGTAGDAPTTPGSTANDPTGTPKI